MTRLSRTLALWIPSSANGFRSAIFQPPPEYASRGISFLNVSDAAYASSSTFPMTKIKGDSRMTTPERKVVKLRDPNADYHQTYVELADHPHQLVPCVHRTVRIHNFIDNYDGPTITIEFDANNRAIGIEILYPYSDDLLDDEAGA